MGETELNIGNENPQMGGKKKKRERESEQEN